MLNKAAARLTDLSAWPIRFHVLLICLGVLMALMGQACASFFAHKPIAVWFFQALSWTSIALVGGLAVNWFTQSQAAKKAHIWAQNAALQNHYELLAACISDVIYTTDSHLRINYVSPSSQTQLGYSPQWLIENGFYALASNQRQLTPLMRLLGQVRASSVQPERLSELERIVSAQVFVFSCLRADGRHVPIELRLNLLRSPSGHFEGLIGIGRDISRQRMAEKDLRMAATVFEHSTGAIMVIDPAGFVVRANQSFVRLTGYRIQQILDQQVHELLAADEQQSLQIQGIFSDLHAGTLSCFEGELWFKKPDAQTYPVWIGITAVVDEDGDLVSFVCFFSDISERKASEQHIHRLAYFDALTQLPNRSLFQERLQQALSHAARHQQWLALMFLDLDRFKPINDSLGHAAGDKMLKEVANRLSASVEAGDTVARMGGDEFTLLLQPEPDRERALRRAMSLAERILAALSEAFILEGREFFVSASIGVALSPQDGTESSQLMKNADTAMYHAKACGKDNYQLYQAQMNAQALERLELESDLRHALELGQLSLAFQAQYMSDGLKLSGVEVLLRWNHPTRGVISPIEFIPLLEELGLVVQIGDWVLHQACLYMRRWDELGLEIPKISVNLSARQFNDGQLDLRLTRILNETGLAPERLELELTESILMRDVNLALSVLRGFKRLGVGIAVDDFGTGYSSLNYLKQFPIDVLKIDRSFVDGLPKGEQDAQIARAIIAMAHSLNLSVIAEGVETAEQLAFLRLHNCDQVQGYLLSKPLSLAEFESTFTLEKANAAS